MKDLRNPLTRTENFEHPSGNIMKELTEAELNSVAAGAGVARNSGGIACTLTGEWILVFLNGTRSVISGTDSIALTN